MDGVAPAHRQHPGGARRPTPSPHGRDPIVVDDVRIAADASGAELSARVTGGGSDLPSRLWFRVPVEYAAALAAGGDAFLPVLLLAAMSGGAPLRIEAEVSAMLLGSTRRIMRLYRDWGGIRPLGEIEITAPVVARERREPQTGAFFSGGVDSFHTVLKNLARYPVGDVRRITHLVLVHGFDIPVENRRLFETVRTRAGEAAAHTGLRLLPVVTNARAAIARLPWESAHGTVLASVALALGGLFDTVLIASSYEFLELRPWGTHPSLDPLWSTETLEIRHDGAELPKPEKMRVVAASPIALRILRVCWENPDGQYNCGRCEKCLRTMVTLAAHGALERAEQFPRVIDPRLVEQLSLGEFIRPRWRDLARQLRARDGDGPVLRAIDSALRRSAWGDCALGRIDARVWALLSRLGLTLARAKSLDRALTGGRATALLRRLQRRA